MQFLYGEDAIDPMNRSYIDKFRFMERNHSIISSKSKPILESGVLQTNSIEAAKKEIRHEAKKIYAKNKEHG